MSGVDTVYALLLVTVALPALVVYLFTVGAGRPGRKVERRGLW